MEEIIKKIKNGTLKHNLTIYNHALNNSLACFEDISSFKKELELNNFGFIGFQKLSKEMIKTTPWGVYDYGMIFEDKENDFEIFWFHIDSDIIYGIIEKLKISEEEKIEIKKSYQYTPNSIKEDEINIDFWHMVSFLGKKF